MKYVNVMYVSQRHTVGLKNCKIKTSFFFVAVFLYVTVTYFAIQHLIVENNILQGSRVDIEVLI